MGGCLSRDDVRGDTDAAAGRRGGAAVSAQQGGPNDAAVDYVQTRGPDEEKFHVAISALQATFNVIDGTAAPLSGQVHHTDSPPGLSEIDLEANHPSLPPLAGYVGCLARSFDFIVKHTKCIVAIRSIVGNCCKVVMVHCTPVGQGEELQDRCYKYSQVALGFEILTVIASYIAAPVVSSSGTGSITILIVAASGLLVAISIDLIVYLMMKKTKLGLVYLSSSLVMSTTFLVFISFNKCYAYGILSIPLLIVAALFQHKLLPGVDDNEEVIQEKLDRIFNTCAYILNFGTFVTLFSTYNVQARFSSASVMGFFFMFTIVLSLFGMMVATARPMALARLATYLRYLLMFLFVGTLTSAFVTAAKTSLHSSG